MWGGDWPEHRPNGISMYAGSTLHSYDAFDLSAQLGHYVGVLYQNREVAMKHLLLGHDVERTYVD